MLNLSHKNLEVYKYAILLSKEIYHITTLFPAGEQYILSSQLKRAAISVGSNISEGASRKSDIEKKRFFEISRSSLVEIDTQIEIALSLNFIGQTNISTLEPIIVSIFKMLTGLINKTKTTSN